MIANTEQLLNWMLLPSKNRGASKKLDYYLQITSNVKIYEVDYGKY